MTDMQILTLTISFTVPMALLFLGNSRLTDMKEGLRAEIMLSEVKLEARLDKLETKLDQKLDVILKILADHEAKLSKL